MTELIDLRMTNQHVQKRRQHLAAFRQRTRARQRRTVPWWKRWLPRVDWDGLLP